MKRRRSIEFIVKVTNVGEHRYIIDIGDQHGADFARVDCGDLWTALEMCLPYMAHAAEPDPLASLIRTVVASQGKEKE